MANGMAQPPCFTVQSTVLLLHALKYPQVIQVPPLLRDCVATTCYRSQATEQALQTLGLSLRDSSVPPCSMCTHVPSTDMMHGSGDSAAMRVLPCVARMHTASAL